MCNVCLTRYESLQTFPAISIPPPPSPPLTSVCPLLHSPAPPSLIPLPNYVQDKILKCTKHLTFILPFSFPSSFHGLRCWSSWSSSSSTSRSSCVRGKPSSWFRPRSSCGGRGGSDRSSETVRVRQGRQRRHEWVEESSGWVAWKCEWTEWKTGNWRRQWMIKMKQRGLKWMHEMEVAELNEAGGTERKSKAEMKH